MTTIRTILLLFILVTVTSCPRPITPDFCAIPDSISVNSGCYDTANGLTLLASAIPGSDKSIQLKWDIYVLPDTSARAPFLNPRLENIPGNTELSIPDSILLDNQKIYVMLRSECDGVYKEKGPGQIAAAFVKRYNKASNCYQWGLQPF